MVKNGYCNTDYRHRVAVKGRAGVWSHDHKDVGVCSFRHPHLQLFVASMSHRSKLCTSWVYIRASTPLHQTTKTPQHVLLLQQPSATEQNCTVLFFFLPFGKLQAGLSSSSATERESEISNSTCLQRDECSDRRLQFITFYFYDPFLLLSVTRLEGRFLGKVYAKATFLSCVTTWKVGIIIRPPVASRGVNGHSSDICNKSDCFESENAI